MPVGDARQVMEAAAQAEAHGWNGFFVSEPVWGVDAWVSMTAAALATSSIRIGTLLSPLSRMRPWQVAAQSATLDHLSGGRLILSVGLGATDSGFGSFGEVTDVRRRAELLDESLDIVTGLWRGQPFNPSGRSNSRTMFRHEYTPVSRTVRRVGCRSVSAMPRSEP